MPIRRIPSAAANIQAELEGKMVRKLLPLFLAVTFALAMSGCGVSPSPTATPVPPTPTPGFRLTSPAFASREMIPAKYGRRGEDISPPLEWSDPPEGTRSFALIVDTDLRPGGGESIWIHWLLYNIPAETRALPEAVTPDAAGRLPNGSQHLANSWEELKYGGPNPPHVSTLNYYFRLYALDTILDPDTVERTASSGETEPWVGASKKKLLQAMEGHILAEAELMGKYKEKK
jgi:Raf kinase inhibitor-like YbhB/YbcL family protein